MLTVYIRSNLLYFSRNMINEICHLSSKVEIMVSICLITRCKYKNRLGLGAVLGILQFQLLFRRIFSAFRLDFGAVLEILAVSATFSRVFSGFWAGLGSCFRSFRDYSTKLCLLCHQPMAVRPQKITAPAWKLNGYFN